MSFGNRCNLLRTSPSPSSRSGSLSTGPPSYRTNPPSINEYGTSNGSRPPSYQSNSPSTDGDRRSSLDIYENPSVPPKATLKKARKYYKDNNGFNDYKDVKDVKDVKGVKDFGSFKSKWDLKPIPEVDHGTQTDPPQYKPPRRRRRRRGCIIAIILACVIGVLIVILVPILVTIGREDHRPITANTTTTVLSTLTATNTLTIATTLTALQSSTSTTPTAVPTPVTPLGGFDAVEFGDESKWMFYTDQYGNIKYIESSASSYYYGDTWTPGFPAMIASGVKAGSAVQVAATKDSITKRRSEIHVFFVGDDNYIHELTTSASFTYSSTYQQTSWTVGTLNQMKIETSDAMFLRACIPWSTSTDYGSIAPDLYLFYSAKNGGIKKLGWWNVQPPVWVALNDTPQVKSGGFVECQNDFGSMENMWIVNGQGHLEQWSHNSSRSSLPRNLPRRDLSIQDEPTLSNWTRGVQYLGSNVHPASNILSITSTLQSLGGRTHIFYQDQNNTIRRLDVNGIGANAYVAKDEIVDQGTPGTRLTTTNSSSSYCSKGTSVTIYYQRNTSEIMYYTFTDYYANGGFASSMYSGYSISSTVETYGLPPVPTSSTGSGGTSGGGDSGGKHFSGGEIFGIVLGVFVLLGLIGICCCS